MKRIFFVIDDDPDDRVFFLEALRNIDSDAECLQAGDGDDALKKLRNLKEQLPDYIFLDLNMPKMDGWECLAEIRNDANLKNIPVIIFTTSNTQKDKDSTLKLGATYFLTKPTDFKKFCNAISFVIQSIFPVGNRGVAFH